MQADAEGWVVSPTSSLDGIAFGSPDGKSVAGSVQGLWVLPGAVAFDTLASTGQGVSGVLAAITAPFAATGAPTVSVQLLTAAPTVGTPISVAVSASAAAGSTVRARVTFWGAAPRWGRHGGTCSWAGCSGLLQTQPPGAAAPVGAC